ncbi:multidrug resistance efflux pump [Luteibacter rhizovicinus]|uniref:Multidrug resistance efflux pump n=1 Tax=Luteibacter rhizovicinus TaxID=242606 RepID=A0A4R3YP62_9GAMM|nr:HlyD family efflux transporter periplasmic adaptor subunit [Luteibacter rhizovicinus]TCV94062.1 multidrug resistance efflux pump [Luteibacter rhizovicinus]
MNAIATHRKACLILLSLALAACSGHGNAPATASAPESNYAAAARGRVDVEGGLLSLSMPRDGVLVRMDVHEGDTVKAGQVLAALDDTPAKLAVAAAEAERAQANAQIASLGKRIAAAKQRAQRLAQAEASGAGDGQSADDAADALVQLGAEQDAATAQVAVLAQKVSSANYELAQRTLRAPSNGLVTRVLARPGASVGTENPLIVLLPDTPRLVRAELSETFANNVQPGMHAEVTADGDAKATPRQATVVRVGSVIGPGVLDDDAQARANSRTVECVLSFDTPQDLRIGQRVLVRFTKQGAKP